MTKKLLIGLIFSALICLDNGEARPSELEVVKQFETGGGKSFESAQHSNQGEVGKKEYSAHHAQEKGETGHHDKELHQKEHKEEGGNKKSQNHDDGYYAADHKESHGEKGYHFVDQGSYAKGHDTKGHHNVHRLNEFEKKKEFFDEDHDEAHKEKHGAFDVAKSFKNGDFKHGGHDKKVFFQAKYGAKGESEKGSHNEEEGGREKNQGVEKYFNDAEQFAENGSRDLFKHFEFNKGDHN